MAPNTTDCVASQENFALLKNKIEKIKTYTLQCECILMTEAEYNLLIKPEESFKNKAILLGDNISYNGVIKNIDKLTKTEKAAFVTTVGKGKIANSIMAKLFENYAPKKYINIPDEIIGVLFAKKVTNKMQRLCISYKPSRATNDLKKRERILSRLAPKQGAANQVVKTSAKMYMSTNGTTALDSEKITRAEKWDGIHGVVTNIMTDKAEDIIARYNNLWRIEDAFRINKHNLNMRPIYHYKKERIYSHIAICYMGFAILKLIQYQTQITQPRFTINNILETLLSVESSIYADTNTKIRYKVPGVMSADAAALYQAFGVKKARKTLAIA